MKFLDETNETKASSDPKEIGNAFNAFFTSLSSKSSGTSTESDSFIDKTFTFLKQKALKN